MRWLRIGHRGAAGTRPELTIPSFEHAIELGVDMIELDVQLTRDHRLVVLHDLELGRTVRATGSVRDRTLAELCAMDAGGWFDPDYAGTSVPSLDEVLALTAGRVRLNVEIKSPPEDWEATARVLVDLLEREGRLTETIISSFGTGALRAVRERAPDALLGVLWHGRDLRPAWTEARRLGARSVHFLWKRVDRSVVETARERGLTLLVWTVNDPADIGLFARLGVGGIISDYPERFTDGGIS